MTKEEFAVKAPPALILLVSSYMAGIVDELATIMLLLMSLDYTTGIFRGILTKSINSTIGLKGIIKKFAMLVVVGVAGCIEVVLKLLGMDTGNFMVGAVICFFIVNESFSCLENAGQLGAPIPAILLNALEKLREVGGKEQKVQRVRRKRTKKEETK